MAKKYVGVSLAALNSTDAIERGELAPDKGSKVMGVVLKLLIGINNTTGGALASGLSEVRKQALLDCFRLTWNFGKDGNYATPMESRSFRDVRRLARICYASELEGWTDTVTGLQRNLPNAAVTNVTLFVLIPTGKLWALDGRERNLLGMGRSQTRTARFEFKRVSDTIDTNIAISGAVTAEVLLDTAPAKGDPWSPVPHYFRTDDSKEEIALPEGLPLHLEENSAVHASSLLTNFSLRVNDRIIHQQVGAVDSIRELADAARLPAAGLVTDQTTVLYNALDAERSFRDLPSGTMVFKQEGTKQIATASLFFAYLPLVKADTVSTEVKNVARDIRRKEIRAVNENAIDGYDVPTRLTPYVPFRMVDRNDREFEQFPGLVADADSAVTSAAFDVPASLADAAKARFNAHTARGEGLAAQAVVDQLSAAIPGAVQSGLGFARGASVIRAGVAARYFR